MNRPATPAPEFAADGTARGQAVLDELVSLLDLEQLELNLFRGVSPPLSPTRVFGGQVAGQALVAAGRTVPADRDVHSLHAYFIRPGDPTIPIVYETERVRDGRSFTTRRVLAIQRGEAIFALSASFQLRAGGPGALRATADRRTRPGVAARPRRAGGQWARLRLAGQHPAPDRHPLRRGAGVVVRPGRVGRADAGLDARGRATAG